MCTHKICVAVLATAGSLSLISSCTVKLEWLKHRWLVYRGWFKLMFESPGNPSDCSRKQIFREIFRIYLENACSLYSLKLPHKGNFNKYSQQTINLWKIVKTSLNYHHLPTDLALLLTLSGSNYLCLRNIHSPKDVWAIEVQQYLMADVEL